MNKSATYITTKVLHLRNYQ